MDGLTIRHYFRLVANEQFLKITTKIHFIRFDITVVKSIVFMVLCNTSFGDAYFNSANGFDYLSIITKLLSGGQFLKAAIINNQLVTRFIDVFD